MCAFTVVACGCVRFTIKIENWLFTFLLNYNCLFCFFIFSQTHNSCRYIYRQNTHSHRLDFTSQFHRRSLKHTVFIEVTYTNTHTHTHTTYTHNNAQSQHTKTITFNTNVQEVWLILWSLVFLSMPVSYFVQLFILLIVVVHSVRHNQH